ncbi:MAG: zinc ribbon domain-containing protein [Armatimonadetes bacterium]|nr:zinc ribbon domain-containing protein [Armatimonadota bacterium]
MPIYEYRCQQCGKKVALLLGMTAQPDEEVCPHCGSRDLRKLVSRFVRGRDEDARLDELSDRLDIMGEPDTERGARELVREAGKAMDEDLSDEMEEMYELDESGEGDLD